MWFNRVIAFALLTACQVSFVSAQSFNINTDSWYWKITPIEDKTVEADGKTYRWRNLRSDFYSSERDCLQAIALRLKDDPLQSNQIIACYDFAPVTKGTVADSWGMRLTYMNSWSEDADGNIIWHSRIPRTTEHKSREDCILDAKERLSRLGGGASNREPNCISPFVDNLSIPIQTIDADILGFDAADLESE